LTRFQSALSLCVGVTQDVGVGHRSMQEDVHTARTCTTPGSETSVWNVALPRSGGLFTLSFWAFGDDGSSKQVHVSPGLRAHAATPVARMRSAAVLTDSRCVVGCSMTSTWWRLTAATPVGSKCCVTVQPALGSGLPVADPREQRQALLASSSCGGCRVCDNY
jgi:hypothetical protein